MKKTNYIITTTKDEFKGGLFGEIVLCVFEILPYLFSRSIFPDWDIKSELYGIEPSYTVIPGVFDIAYNPKITSEREIRLRKLRRLMRKHISVLGGGDWEYMNKLWHAYFQIPDRIVLSANEIGDLSNTIGVHYRGTDKKFWDTNPISHEEFILLVEDFIKKQDGIESILVSTDEYVFVEKIKKKFTACRIINLGAVVQHLDKNNVQNKGDRAILDCLLLSRCKYLILTSSALSGFAKVLNPRLECYRVCASKLFADIPYFPVAYIPILITDDVNCNHILKKTLNDDWLQNRKANKKFNNSFCTKKHDIWPFIIRRLLDFIIRLRKIALNKVWPVIAFWR